MTALKLFWQNSKWIALLIVAVGIAILVWFLRGLLSSADKDRLPKRKDGSFLPPIPEPLQAAVENAQEAALVTKATSKETTKAEKAKLKRIMTIKDGKKRRTRLAEWISSS